MLSLVNRANLKDLIAATGLVILLKLDSHHPFFSLCDLEIWWTTSKNYRAPLLHYIKLCASSQTPWLIQLESLSGTAQFRSKSVIFFVPWDLEIWRMTLKSNSSPLLCYIKLCASFESHWWIQTGVTIQKRSIQVKIHDFFVPCDLQIWWMTLKNNRALLLRRFKLNEPFHSHRWIKTKVTVRKCSIRVKIGDFLPHVSLKFNGCPWKTTGHLFYVSSSLMHQFIAISEFKLKLQSGTAQFGSKLAILCPLWPWNLTDDLEKQ